VPQEHSRLRFVADNVRSVISRVVYTRCVYQSSRFRHALNVAMAEFEPQLVHADSLDLAVYFDALEGLPLACTHHDVQSALLLRRAELQRQGSARWYLRHQASLMRREEEQWCPKVALNVVVSDEDKRALCAVAPGGRFHVAPNGVDTDAFAPQGDGEEPEDRRTILFVGSSGWEPNRDAMEYFACSIWPRIKQDFPSAQCRWAGRIDTSEAVRFQSHGIETLGHVDDLRPCYQRAACVIAPIRAGGGSRVKIIEAWAMGKAVVSTSIGAEGLLARDGENILVRDEPAAFAAAVVDILSDPSRRLGLCLEARSTATGSYSWETIGGSLRDVYCDLLAAPQTPRSHYV
jgi:glycosyltransferase involved in cell wall biosynthesis